MMTLGTELYKSSKSRRLVRLINELSDASFLPSSGSSIILVYLLALFDAESEARDLNKSKLMAVLPDRLGSSSRRRYLLEHLINSGAAISHQGKKKSEKIVNLTPKSKSILERYYE